MNNPLGTYTLFLRETKRFMRVYMQTLLAPVVSNILYLVIFGLSMNRSVPIEGVTYLQFLIPGLIMMGIINNAFQNPSSSIMIMKYQGLITDFTTVPLKKIEILSAITASAVLRAVLVGIMTYLTGIFFVDFPYTSIAFILFTAITVSLFFSFLGIIVGIWAKEFDRQAFIMNFLLMPLIFLGGVFFPVTKLPGVFSQIAQFNPMVYMIDLLRYGFTGVHEFPLFLGLGIISGVTLLTGIIAYLILRSGYQIQT